MERTERMKAMQKTGRMIMMVFAAALLAGPVASQAQQGLC